MMGIQLQLIILTAYFVIPGWTLVQLHNPSADQVVTSIAGDAGGIQGNIQNNLLNSIAKNNIKKSKTYHGIIKREIVEGQQIFNKMREELQTAQKRNAIKKRNLYRESNAGKENVMVKREVVIAEQRTATTVQIAAPFNETADDKVLRELRMLWRIQLDLVERFGNTVKNLSETTGHHVREMGWFLNTAEWLVQRQLEELWILPKNMSESTKHTLDDDTCHHISFAWECLEGCLNKDYKYVKGADDQMRELRSIIETARADFKRRNDEIRLFVIEESPEPVTFYPS